MDVEKPPGTEDDPDVEGSAAEPGKEQDAAAAQVTAHSHRRSSSVVHLPELSRVDVCLSYAMGICAVLLQFQSRVLGPLSSGMW